VSASPGAFRDTLARDDITARFNHNLILLLGRKSARTLTLAEDAKRLRYTIQVNAKDPMATGVLARFPAAMSAAPVSGSSQSATMTNRGSVADRASFHYAR